jgi:hypothetical protein
MACNHDIVTCIATAKQRLGKHIPAEANASNNRTSTARQRISKYASLTIESVFSAWYVQMVIKKGLVAKSQKLRKFS